MGTDGAPPSTSRTRTIVAFWFIGLLNRATFIVMLACAKEISEGGTALVYIFNTLPRLIGNISVPYRLYAVSYDVRMYITAALFGSSYIIVGSFSSVLLSSGTTALVMQLLGVGVGALGYGIGESSLLALGGRFDSSGVSGMKKKGVHLTSFSSGSGSAGLFGYLWKALLNDWLGLSITITLFLGVVLAFAYGYIFYLYLKDGPVNEEASDNYTAMENSEESKQELPDENAPLVGSGHSEDVSEFCGWSPRTMAHVDVSEESSLKNRLSFVRSLWPYMVPMFLVYFAEYGLQSGTWAAIGFPVTSAEARASFYLYSNWMYQAGTFLSRSSGTLYEGTIPDLWIMAGLQIANLIFFVVDGVYHFLYNWSLLALCFAAGIFGGGVYINAYTRINKDLPAHQREFALASASIADSFGTLLADNFGLFLQSCLYKANGLDQAAVSCPF